MAATKLSVYNGALRLLGDSRLATPTDDVAIRYVLDDAWTGAIEFVLRQAPWRFALKTVTLAVGGTAYVGYTTSYAYPATWLRTHAIFLSTSDGRECPIDLRDQTGFISVNVATAPTMRFIGTEFADPELAGNPWPAHFTKLAEAFLAFSVASRDTGSAAVAGHMSDLFASLLPEAMRHDAVSEDRWLPHQRDGGFLRAAHAVLGAGYWAFRGADGVMRGLKEVQIDTSMQLATAADYGFPYRYPLPDDWIKTHSLFVPWDGRECPINIRQSASDWSTDAEAFVARYIGTDALLSTAWPEIVTEAVYAYCAWKSADGDGAKGAQADYERVLAEALALHSRKEDDWLRFQLNGDYQQAVGQLLERGRWRFAVKTESLTESSDPIPALGADGTVTNSYGYRFIHPNDLYRLIWVYYLQGSGLYACRADIDFRDEGGAIHANYTPVTVRYVSRLGLDSVNWPAIFRRAVHACLLHLERPDDPKMLAMYKAAVVDAEDLDDARDMPPVRSMGRFVAGRYW